MECFISFGEIFDKLSIHEIRLKNKDIKKSANIMEEYKYLNDKISHQKSKINFFYNILLKINENIIIRNEKIKLLKSGSNEWISECKTNIIENDIRSRLILKIDNVLNPQLIDQKECVKKKAYIVGHQGIGDLIMTNSITRFLSTLYDEVYVLCETRHENFIRTLYRDDKTIIIYPVNDMTPNKFNIELTDSNSTLFKMGYFYGNMHTPFDIFPLCFYDDCKIPYFVFWEYFYIPEIEKKDDLYEILIKNGIEKYIFIHNRTSYGKLFTDIDIQNKFGISKHDIFFISPDTNMYNDGDKYYDLAHLFINKKILDHVNVIKYAKKNILSDSCFFCLAIRLDIITDENYVIHRDGHTSYDYIWSDKFCFDGSKKKFKSITFN